MRYKNLIYAIICFVIFPCLLLIVLEIGLKIIGVKSLYQQKFEAKSNTKFRDDHSFYLIDKDLLWRLQPDTSKVVDKNLYKINSHGLRSPEFTIAKQSGVYRIAVFGDSSTFGLNLPYNEIYHQYLLYELEKRYPQKKFEVINFGVPGYSSKQGLVVFYQWIDKINPDLIIVSFGANDGYSVPAGNMGDMDIIGSSTTYAVYLRSQLERSRIATIMNKLIEKVRKAGGESKNTSGSDNSFKVRVGARDYEQNIKTIAAMSKKRGIPAIFINISIAEEYSGVLKKLSESKVIEFRDVEKPLQELYYSNDRDKFLSQFSTNQIKTPIIPEIDKMCTKLLGEKQMKIRRDRLLFTDDFHPNAAGNYVIANTLLNKLIDLTIFK